MFLVIKKGLNILALDAADATIAAMYASIKEEYKDLNVDIQFTEPNCEIIINLIKFIKKVDQVFYANENILEKNSDEFVEEKIELDEENSLILEEVKNEISIIEDALEESSLILEEINKNDEELECIEVEDITNKIEPIVEEVENTIKEVQVEEAAPVVEEKKVKVSPADRMMEALKEEQKNAGLPELENDKINTLSYKEYLLNYMKMGFASNILKKKARDCKDVAEQARYNAFCEAVDTRTEDYEMTFKKIGLTSGQVHTFRMEVLREVKKYSDDSIREIYEYLNKLYQLSTKLINEIK